MRGGDRVIFPGIDIKLVPGFESREIVIFEEHLPAPEAGTARNGFCTAIKDYPTYA